MVGSLYSLFSVMFCFSVARRTTWVRFADELPYNSGLSTILHICQVRINLNSPITLSIGLIVFLCDHVGNVFLL